MKIKSIRTSVGVITALALAGTSLLLAGCAKDEEDTSGLRVLKVGASPTPHALILNSVKEQLKEEGIDLQVTEFTDYVAPNEAVQSGELDANYFQHLPYLDDFNLENGTTIASVAAIHFEPLGLYAGKTSSLESLADGAKVALPNDTTNEARALKLLATEGLITLPDNAGFDVTPRDIVDNPKNLEFVEVEAASVPAQLGDVDIAVINGNYALDADIPESSRLAGEEVGSESATTYANIVAVKEGNEQNEDIQALIAALTSDKTREYINNTFDGVVVPVF
jgi:D-methionine transport system substrate-binding protein